jgi:hypothetical protein
MRGTKSEPNSARNSSAGIATAMLVRLLRLSSTSGSSASSGRNQSGAKRFERLTHQKASGRKLQTIAR